MIIEKFENMTIDKYAKLLPMEKRIFSYYEETKEKNYDEITITEFPFTNFEIIKNLLYEMKKLNINKIYFAENSTALLKYLHIFQKIGCKLGNIFILDKDKYTEKEIEAIEIYLP